MNPAQREEQTRLQSCLESIARNLQLIGVRLSASAKDIQETTTYMWEARRDLDHIDKVAMRQAIEQKSSSFAPNPKCDVPSAVLGRLNAREIQGSSTDRDYNQFRSESATLTSRTA